MLRAEHHATIYARPTFRTHLGTGQRRYREALQALLEIHEVGSDRSLSRLRDSATIGLEEFVRQHEVDRHYLVMKKLRGEPLSLHEALALASINARLEQLLPPPERRPQDVSLAVTEARRLLEQIG